MVSGSLVPDRTVRLLLRVLLLAYSLGGLEVKQALCGFDAKKAKCFLRSDRERLLGVIEAAFGDCTPFNRLVRHIFTSEGKVEEGEELSMAPVVPGSSRDAVVEYVSEHPSPPLARPAAASA